jgi:hypothetical protein
MDAMLQLPQYDWLGSISYRDVKKFFDLKDLYMGNRKKKEAPRYQCRYQTNYANMIWHADFHFFSQGPGFATTDYRMDRRSIPKCLGFKLLPSRCSIQVSVALKEILLVYPPPYAIWTDNKGAFQGDFEK